MISSESGQNLVPEDLVGLGVRHMRYDGVSMHVQTNTRPRT